MEMDGIEADGGLVWKAPVLVGGAPVIKRFTKYTTWWDHARLLSQSLCREKAFCRTCQKPFRQRFFMVTPCPKDLKCDVELSTNAIRDMEEYKSFCDHTKDQKPLPEEVIGNGATYCTSELAILKSSDFHAWYRGYYDDEGNPVQLKNR